MGIASLTAFALCAFVYIGMIRREVPGPIGKKQAVVPVAVGFFLPIPSTVLAVLFGWTFFTLTGKTVGEAVPNLLCQSLVKSFLFAGFTEELVKLLPALLLVRIFKPKNVYEHILIFAGVGFGFTALEEILYSGGIAAFTRLPAFATHMVLGIITGTYLGLARRRKRGKGKLVFTGLFLPVLWHTLFDAATGFNAGLSATNENVQLAAIAAGLVATAVSTVLLFVLLFRLKNKAAAYSGMTFE